MKLSLLTGDSGDSVLMEWGWSREYRAGYKLGITGQTLSRLGVESPEYSADFQRGWKAGYHSFVCKQRPELC